MRVESLLGLGPDRRDLVKALADREGVPLVWDTHLNVRAAPSWFLAYEDDLVGALAVFDPGEDPEVSGVVASAHRRQGVFRALEGAAARHWPHPWLYVVTTEVGAVVAERRGRWAFSEYTLRREGPALPPAAWPQGWEWRRACADDEDALVALRGEDDRPFLRNVLADSGRALWGVVENGRWWGTAGAVREADAVEVFGVYLDPERRGKGWGRSLVEAVLASEPASVHTLEVDSTNARAEALYRGLGFVDHAVTKYYRTRS